MKMVAALFTIMMAARIIQTAAMGQGLPAQGRQRGQTNENFLQSCFAGHFA